MGVKKYDMGKVKLDYVVGVFNEETQKTEWPSAQLLADKHGASLATVNRHLTNEDWPKLRQEYQEQCYQTALARNIEERSLQIQEFDRMCEKVATRAIEHIFRKFMRCEDENKMEQLLVKFAKPLLDYQKAGRLALALPTEISNNRTLELRQEIDSTTDSLSIDQLREALAIVRYEHKA